MSHTPGPWRIGLKLGDGWAICTHAPLIRIADVKGGTESAANAQLMAVAPDMYEFVKDHAEAGNPRAKQLLAKAEGK